MSWYVVHLLIILRRRRGQNRVNSLSSFSQTYSFQKYPLSLYRQPYKECHLHPVPHQPTDPYIQIHRSKTFLRIHFFDPSHNFLCSNCLTPIQKRHSRASYLRRMCRCSCCCSVPNLCAIFLFHVLVRPWIHLYMLPRYAICRCLNHLVYPWCTFLKMNLRLRKYQLRGHALESRTTHPRICPRFSKCESLGPTHDPTSILLCSSRPLYLSRYQHLALYLCATPRRKFHHFSMCILLFRVLCCLKTSLDR